MRSWRSCGTLPGVFSRCSYYSTWTRVLKILSLAFSRLPISLPSSLLGLLFLSSFSLADNLSPSLLKSSSYISLIHMKLLFFLSKMLNIWFNLISLDFLFFTLNHLFLENLIKFETILPCFLFKLLFYSSLSPRLPLYSRFPLIPWVSPPGLPSPSY